MSAAAALPTRSQILNIFRSLLRVSRKFPDYNIRHYVNRRTADAFSAPYRRATSDRLLALRSQS
ncbi:hypothetical protein RND81_08G183200 [Saponaria officinalis]|uniref:Complex 1 LYR protein domain-containing protein n=1 Tax=Saponaria officinalis TaxID=3572 RepID=A0AAW1J9L1_SAPOF